MRGNSRENCPKTLFSQGNPMTIKFGKFANFSVRNLLSFRGSYSRENGLNSEERWIFTYPLPTAIAQVFPYLGLAWKASAGEDFVTFSVPELSSDCHWSEQLPASHPLVCEMFTVCRSFKGQHD